MAETTELVTIERPRLPYPKGVEERFGVDRASWKALVEAVWPLAKTPDAVALALSYCRARKLDPFKRPVHIVPMWNSALQREVETVWPGVSEHRITASRTKQHAGNDATEFGPSITETFRARTKKGEELTETLTFPEWAQITVYRLMAGQRVAFPGPRCYFKEWYGQRKGVAVPNDRWCRAPTQMLEKCAEAAALRRAFPEEIGDEPTAEEMEGHTLTGGEGAKDITPERPVRENYKAYELYDETGVLIETLFSPEEWKVAYEHAKDRAGDVDAIVEANAATVHAIYGSAPQGGPTSPPAATEPLTAAAPATINQEGGDRHVPAANPGIVAPAGTAHPEAAQGITLVYTNGERQEYADTKEDAEAYMAALKTACEGDKRTWGLNVPTARAVAKRYGLMGSAKALNAKYGEAGA